MLRAIKSGKISGSKNEMGEWLVEPVELHRVYSPVARTDADPLRRTGRSDRCTGRGAARIAGGHAGATGLLAAAGRAPGHRRIDPHRTPMRSAASVPSVTVVARRSWLPWRQSA